MEEVNDAAGPDAALLAACAVFDTLEREQQALLPDPGDGEKIFRQLGAIEELQKPFLDIITSHRAVTLEGLRARVASLCLWMRTGDSQLFEDARAGFWDARLIEALVRDLAPENFRLPRRSSARAV